MAYPDDQRSYVKEEDATFVSITRVGIPRVRELTRRWDKIKDKQVEACVRLLEEYTSAKNPTPQYFVDNPRAVGPRGQQEYAGVWRLVSVSRTKDDPQGIVEVLREGFQQHSGDSTDPLDQAEARISLDEGNPTIGTYHARQDWRYTDPASHDQILADLTAIASVSDPVVEGRTLSGLFACSKVMATPNPDGSVLWSRTITQMTVVDDVTDLAPMLPLVSQEEEVLNHFGFESGNEKKKIYIYPNVDPASRGYLMDTATLADLTTQIAPGAGWVAIDRKFDPDIRTGVATFTVLFMQEEWDATYAADKNTVQGDTVSGWLRNLAIQATGEDRAQALADFSAAVVDLTGPAFAIGTNYNKGDAVEYSGSSYIFHTTHPAGAWNAAHVWEANYLLNGRRITERGRGEFVVSGNMISVYEGTANEHAEVVFLSDSLADDDRRMMRRVWFRRSAQAVKVLTTQATGAARLDYTFETDTFTHISFAVEDHQNGSYTVRQTLGEVFDENKTPVVMRIRPGITEWEQDMLVRSWTNITEDGKNALVAPLNPTAPLDPAGDARSNYTFNDVLYTHADCFISGNGNGGYTVRQVLMQLHSGSDDSDALIIRPSAALTTHQQKTLTRVWLHRTTTAKNYLMQKTYAAGPPVQGAARNDYTFEGEVYTHVNSVVADTGHGGYNVTQTLVRLFSETDDSDALMVQIKPEVSGGTQAMIQRVWPSRSITAKNLLIDPVYNVGPPVQGAARNSYVFEGKTYSHVDLHIQDHGNGGYTVRQTLVDFAAGLDVYWNKDISGIERTLTRSSDDLTKVLSHTKHISREFTEKDGWDYIDGKSNVVAGSSSVVKVKAWMYRAQCLSLDNVANWG